MATGWPMKVTYANGDVYSASDVNDTNGTVNLASGAQWAAGKNKIINGNFANWQRGTSFTGTGVTSLTYQADRFYTENNSTTGLTISQQTFTPGTAPVAGYEGQYFLRYALATASTFQGLAQKIEDVRTCAGQTVTVSVWAKAAAATTVSTYVTQYFGTGGSATADAGNTTFALTTSWQRFTFTVAVPSVSGKTIGTSSSLGIRLLNLTNTTFTMDFWGLQVEAASSATAFQTATGTIQGELAACQRYCYAITAGTNYSGRAYNSTFLYQSNTPFPVTMRTAPTLRSGGSWTANSGNNGTMGMDGASTTSANLYNSATNWTTNAGLNFSATFEAEL